MAATPTRTTRPPRRSGAERTRAIPGGASRPRPPMPKLGLGGIGNSGAAAATPLTARKPPGLGLSLGGGGDAPASRSAEPSPPDAANPSGAIPRMSLSEHRPVGLNLGALRDEGEGRRR